MFELSKSNFYEMEILSEVKKLLKTFNEPSMNTVNEKFIAFEHALISEIQKDLNYVTSLEDVNNFLSLNSEIQK